MTRGQNRCLHQTLSHVRAQSTVIRINDHVAVLEHNSLAPIHEWCVPSRLPVRRNTTLSARSNSRVRTSDMANLGVARLEDAALLRAAGVELVVKKLDAVSVGGLADGRLRVQAV